MSQWRWVAAFACMVAIAVAVSLPFAAFTIDDAFITFRQAARLAGGSLSYNAGSMIEASSSLLHVLLIAGLMRLLNASPEMSALALGFLGIAVTAAALTWHAREHAGSDARTVPTAMALPAVILSGTSISAWWFLGLETPLWMTALVVAAASIEAWIWRDHHGARSVALGAAIVLPLLRPEGALIALAWFGALVVLRPSAWARMRWLLLATTLTFVIVGLARLSVFGLWFPAPVYLKAPTGDSGPIVGGAYYVLSAFQFDRRAPAGWLFAACVTAAAVWWLVPATGRALRVRLTDALPALIPCVLLMGMAVLVGGDWMPAYRLIVPTFPLLGMAIVAAGEVRSVRIFPFVVVAAATGLGLATHRGEMDRGLFASLREADPCQERLAGHLGRAGNAGEVLSAADIGLLGYRFPGDVLDYFGVAHPALARAGRGNGKATADDVLEGHPAWLVVYASDRVVWPDWPTDLPSWARPVTESLARSEVVRREYEIVDQCRAYQGRWHVLMRKRTLSP